MFCVAFMCLQFRFVIFWEQEIDAKDARKMMVKLTKNGIKFHKYLRRYHAALAIRGFAIHIEF